MRFHLFSKLSIVPSVESLLSVLAHIFRDDLLVLLRLLDLLGLARSCSVTCAGEGDAQNDHGDDGDRCPKKARMLLR